MALNPEQYEDLLEDMKPENLWAGSKWEYFIRGSNQIKGRFGEQIVMRDLKEQGWNSEVNSGHDFDVLVEGKYRLEVKIAASRKGDRASGAKILVDSMQWQHLNILEDKCDAFAFVGVNPDINYCFKKGGRTEFDEVFILYFTSQQLVDFLEDKETKYLYKQYNGTMTGKTFLSLIDYGKNYKKFTP